MDVMKSKMNVKLLTHQIDECVRWKNHQAVIERFGIESADMANKLVSTVKEFVESVDSTDVTVILQCAEKCAELRRNYSFSSSYLEEFGKFCISTNITRTEEEEMRIALESISERVDHEKEEILIQELKHVIILFVRELMRSLTRAGAEDGNGGTKFSNLNPSSTMRFKFGSSSKKRHLELQGDVTRPGFKDVKGHTGISSLGQLLRKTRPVGRISEQDDLKEKLDNSFNSLRLVLWCAISGESDANDIFAVVYRCADSNDESARCTKRRNDHPKVNEPNVVSKTSPRIISADDRKRREPLTRALKQVVIHFGNELKRGIGPTGSCNNNESGASEASSISPDLERKGTRMERKGGTDSYAIGACGTNSIAGPLIS